MVRWIGVGFGVLAAAQFVGAQAKAPAAGSAGSVLGVITDSLHDRPLVEAIVTVVQLPRRSAMTTPAGAFRIDSLPAGKYTLEISHPLLDSLGIRVVSDTLLVQSGAVRTTTLAVPSAATLAGRLCPPLKQRVGPAVLVGQVLDADTDAPVASAQVSVAWQETQVSAETGVRTEPRVRSATTAADGTFRVCGLPATFTGSVQAIQGALRTAEVRVETTQEPLMLRVLRLPSRQDVAVTVLDTVDTVRKVTRVSTLRHGRAVVTGRVTNRGGVAVDDARVSVQGSVAAATSGKDGTFTLTGVPTGTQSVFVRRVGYAPVELTLDVAPRGPNQLTVRLGEYTPQLPNVEVKAKPMTEELTRVGFTHRKAMGFGQFRTEADIEKAQPVFTSDVLRRINGLHVVGNGHDLTVTSSRGEGCVEYVVDRNHISPSQGLTIDDVVRPMDIAALEFYQAADAPAEFSTGRSRGCALLIVWTRSKLKELSPKK